MKNFRNIFALLLVTMLAFTLVPVATAETTTKTTLNAVYDALHVNLVPSEQNDIPSVRIVALIYDTLVDFDEDLNIIPNLAESWEFTDDTTLELFLKKGVKFHNGNDFTAADVKYSLDLAKVSPHTAETTEMFDEIIVVDDHHVTLTLKAPYAPTLAHLAHKACSIISKDEMEKIGVEAYNEAPVGTGAFQYESFTPGDRVVLKRFDDYHDTLPQLEEVIIRQIADASTRVIELEAGTADLVLLVSPEDISRVESNDALKMIRSTNLTQTYIGFNCEKEPFNNPLVRQAINYAIDKDSIVDVVFKGTGAPSNGPLAAKVWASTQNELEKFEYDIEKAKALLTEAGYPNGFSCSIWANDNNAQRKDIAVIVQASLAQIGIDCAVEYVEWGKYLDDTAVGAHDMFILGWSTSTGDPDYGLYNTFHTNAWGTTGNRAFYTSEEVDKLLDAGKIETDMEARAKIYADAQQIIRDDAPWVFVWQGEDCTGVAANLHGFVNNPTGGHKLQNIYFD